MHPYCLENGLDSGDFMQESRRTLEKIMKYAINFPFIASLLFYSSIYFKWTNDVGMEAKLSICTTWCIGNSPLSSRLAQITNVIKTTCRNKTS